MRQKLFIFVGLILLALLLVGLNAASYVEKPEVLDDEIYPNRSTYNGGATGTRALYELLAETGRKPTRWQEPPSALRAAALDKKNNLATFVVVGKPRREFTELEMGELLEWVSLGGRLVVIDRAPPAELISTTANWKISFAENEFAPNDSNASNNSDIDSSNQRQMTDKTAAAKPVQPSIFTRKVNAVQPSRFASRISFERLADAAAKGAPVKTITAAPIAPPQAEDSNQNAGTEFGSGSYSAPPPPAAPSSAGGVLTTDDDEIIESPAQIAPVAHLAGDGKNLLVDFPFGSGQIVFLADPYIVSNGGINLVDNAQIAVNILTERDGVIAFDEYHQGFGANNNRFLDYFAGTPAAAFFVQAAVLIGLFFLAQSLRFARSLPEDEPNRLSKLEYVSAMAELQQRTRAFDLAIENIYTDFRRRAARLVGADNHAVSPGELAKLIADRTGGSANEIENLMRRCEEIVRGERTNKKDVLEITKNLRKIEEKLGLKRQRNSQ